MTHSYPYIREQIAPESSRRPEPPLYISKLPPTPKRKAAKSTKRKADE